MPDIRIARQSDAAAFPAIENSAGQLFRVIPDLAWIADGEDLSEAQYRALISKGASWVATDPQDRPIGFLAADIQDGALHIWEFAVAWDQQRRGIGRALFRTAFHHASARWLGAITLTTFKDVPWNEPFYRSLGFQTLDAAGMGERLAALLRRDAERGLPPDQRCAMRLWIH
jgi:ribosomal protein S18 acetylase RimI-like enzyme